MPNAALSVASNPPKMMVKPFKNQVLAFQRLENIILAFLNVTWTLHINNRIEIPLNFEDPTTNTQVV